MDVFIFSLCMCNKDITTILLIKIIAYLSISKRCGSDDDCTVDTAPTFIVFLDCLIIAQPLLQTISDKTQTRYVGLPNDLCSLLQYLKY